jgi:flagellar basal-body rod modification protein FlgD
MAVAGVTAATGTGAETTTTKQTKKAATVQYDQFLQLLVAELKNQDPTNPSDATQFISQLASFSNVEQQVQTNTKLDALLTSSSLTQASAIVGHSVISQDQSISGKVVAVNIDSSGAIAILEDGQSVSLGSGVTII